MKNRLLKALGFTTLFLTGSCAYIDDFVGGDDEEKQLRFIDEYVIPDGTMFQNTLVGGLSGIDYAHGSWFIISDDPNNPRFYSATLDFGSSEFKSVVINSVVSFKNSEGEVLSDGITDPEALRIDGDRVVWTSEGNINSGIPPSINFATLNGVFGGVATLADRYNVSTESGKGPRQNGTFEGISLSYDNKGYWVTMELPLQEDGPSPTLQDTDSPIRVAYINKTSASFGKEFAYELDPVVRPAANGTTFELNGVVELLQYDKDKFLFLERSFSTGYSDGGNNVKIYDVDISNATDVSGIVSLQDSNFQSAKKTLLFDFEDIRDQLMDGIVDNIEGIAFGPDFTNGNKSLVLVADNNFSAFGPQLNQFVLFELLD